VRLSSIKAYRYQLRSKPALQAQLRRYAGMGRWVWNKALAEQRERHARGEKYAGFAQMCKWLTAWRNEQATCWLAQGPIHPQQQVLKRLHEAYRRFFAKTAGFPKFKARGLEPGIRFPGAKQFELDAANGRIRLPKLGWVRLRYSRPVAGELCNVSITREGPRWFASIQTEGPQVLAAGLAPTLGIDVGVAAFAATSQERIIEPLQAFKRQLVRLRRYQRSVARKNKGSCNRRKAVKRLGALHRRIARQRRDWLHQLTTRLVGEHPVIAIEDLKVAAMSASARGTAARPGKRVRQKAGLNRAILDQAWGEFRRQLQYKAAACGGQVIAVNPAYTSRTCRLCGHESAENRKTQALFACVACGHTENADVNAAKNILAAGLAVWTSEHASMQARAPAACGEDARRRAVARPRSAASAKQEPAEAKALA
jgi:putative transposase